MKNRLWLFQIPIILLFTGAFYITEQGAEGRLDNVFLREKVFPSLRRVSGLFTDTKFRIRGPEAPKNRIVIVEIDSPALEQLGRWPWHRDVTAKLIEKTFAAGAKVVGLDMVFSEPDQRVPTELAGVLAGNKLAPLVDLYETDHQLTETIRRHADNLVLGWTTEAVCIPKHDGKDNCPVTNPDAIASLPQGIEKYDIGLFNAAVAFNPEQTPLASTPIMLANIPEFTGVGKHGGFFNAFQDPDAYIRRTSLVMFANGKPYPSLPLEMARVGMNEMLQIETDRHFRVSNLAFAKSGRKIPVNRLGVMDVNFRGPSHSFTYIPALDVINDDDKIKDELNRKLAGQSKTEVLRDAYVLIGLSALGVFDMRAFPFDSNSPGVEGHAAVLDNILSGDAMLPDASGSSGIIMILLMTLGVLAFGIVTEKLESVPALILFAGAFGVFGAIDTQLLFKNHHDWNTGFLYIEMGFVFVFTLAAKYVLEERNKKFIKSAFNKYVAPSIVDSILKDPSKLSLGGERRDLTILFSDIRGFTTFSEQMDAKALAAFLNDYLGIMTKIVFAHEGTLDKYIGDAVMAFWGAPLDQSKHAQNACRAAIAMMKALEENYKRFKTQYGVDVRIGIGLNTGIVSVGNMGSENNFEYTVIGDHVNLASRLEGLTKAYGAGIVTTRFTIEHIQALGEPLPPHRSIDSVKVKGKKNAVELIQLLERDYPAEGLELFQAGRVLYSQQKWDEAIAKFNAANVVLGALSPDGVDGPSQVYLERCEEFKKSPPGPDWDGSWEMHSK